MIMYNKKEADDDDDEGVVVVIPADGAAVDTEAEPVDPVGALEGDAVGWAREGVLEGAAVDVTGALVAGASAVGALEGENVD